MWSCSRSEAVRAKGENPLEKAGVLPYKIARPGPEGVGLAEMA
jgi:hypothetical protein